MSLSIKEYDPVSIVPDNVWAMMGMLPRGAQLQQWVLQGLPIAFYKRLAVILDIPESRLRQSLCISPSTLSRRAAAGRLNTMESDRLVSLLASWMQPIHCSRMISACENVDEVARTWAERTIAALRIKVRGTDEVLDTVTASFGVALTKAGDDVESLLTRADDALYLAKRSGRNRVN